MLEIDYKVDRNEGTKLLTFQPDDKIKTINSNAIYLQAPNAKGKSYLLNILAIGFFGHRLDTNQCRISKSLKTSIEDIMNRQDQNLTFNIKLVSKDGNLELISQKENPTSNDIHIKEIIDGKENDLPLSRFMENYYLIYDIPENPLHRLKEIIIEIGEQQNRYKEKVTNFKKYLEDIKIQIKNARNQEELDNIKSKIDYYKNAKDELYITIKGLSNKYNSIEKYFALREYVNYVEYYQNCNDLLERNNSKIKKKEKVKKKFSTEYNNQKSITKEKIGSINLKIFDLRKKIKNIFIDKDKELQEHIDYWAKINLQESVDTFKIDSNIYIELKFINKKITEQSNNKTIKESGMRGTFYNELLNILKSYKNFDIRSLGLEKSTDELISIIVEENKKNEQNIRLYKELLDTKLLTIELEKEIKLLYKNLENLKIAYNRREKSNSVGINVSEIDNEAKELESKLTVYEDKINYYIDIAKKYNLNLEQLDIKDIELEQKAIIDFNKDLKIILQTDENNIQKELEKLKDQLVKLQESYNENEATENEFKVRYSELDERKPHKYQKYSEQIDSISDIVDKLESDLIKYEKIIRKISNNNEPINSEEELKFNDVISRYFALKIPEFPYINEFIKPEEINLLTNTIRADGGNRIINMKDISTGQGMSMYIQAVLNRPCDDKRKIIAIFDETFTMDSKSIEPIKRLMKKLMDENRLILAIFARAVEDDIKIINME